MVAAVYVAFSAHTAHVSVFWCVTYCYMYAKHNRSHCKRSSTQLRSRVIVMWFFGFCVLLCISLSIPVCIYTCWIFNVQYPMYGIQSQHPTSIQLYLKLLYALYNNNNCDHRSVLGCCYVYAFHVNLFPHFELCILTAVYMIFRTTIMRTQILRKATTAKKVHTENFLAWSPFVSSL